jgi:rhodanese-related sulfurtransferase
MVVIIILSVVLGAAVHFPLLRRFAAGEFREGFLDRREYSGIRFITLVEAEDLFNRRMRGEEGLLFIDSRSREEFSAGHIPGALPVPLEELKRPGSPEAGLESSVPLAFPGARTLVVYCEGGDCRTSLALAQIIYDRGYTDIRVFAGGWLEWNAAGLPESRGQ